MTVKRTTICSGCGEIAEVESGGYCASCEPRYEETKRRVRTVREPWRRVYQLAAYRRACALAKRRDGHRCRVVERGRRCVATTDLTIDHDPSLEQMWRQADGVWRVFVALACALEHLRTVCRHHHGRLEAARRATRSRFL